MSIAELAAGVQLGHDHFGGGYSFPRVDVGRYPAAVVVHGAGAVRIKRDHHLLGEAGERLVDGVVNDLVHHVMQAGAVIGIADIHARPFAHGIEAFEDLDRFRPIIGGNSGRLAGGFGHGYFRIECKRARWNLTFL